jgi:hypoxanthine phosphoribosyltransferase
VGQSQEPGSLRICALFDKLGALLFDLDVAYTDFTLPDRFVVGYGLDHNERYRGLPFVGVLKEEAIAR